jgi:hypothetical protein
MSDIGANSGSSSTTPFTHVPRTVDLRPVKGSIKEKAPEPKLEAPACTSQANNEVPGKASNPVVVAPSNKTSTTSVATSPKAAEKQRFECCGGSLAWETTGDQRRYKCTKCPFNIKRETIKS